MNQNRFRLVSLVPIVACLGALHCGSSNSNGGGGTSAGDTCSWSNASGASTCTGPAECCPASQGQGGASGGAGGAGGSDTGGSKSACDDVSGIYHVTLDTTASSDKCSDFAPTNGDDCTVVQGACSVTIGCKPQDLLQSGALDAGDSYSFTLQTPYGPAQCSVDFDPNADENGMKSLAWQCSFTAGDVVLCKGYGAANF